MRDLHIVSWQIEFSRPSVSIYDVGQHGNRGPGIDAPVSRSMGNVHNDPRADRDVLHRVVRVHPVTRRTANDYDGSRRLLHRRTVAGTRPLGP